MDFNIIFAPVRPDLIGKAIETLYKYTDPSLFQVIIVDQTKDGLPQEIRDKAHVWVRSNQRPNLGFAKAANTGIRLASHSDYIIMANDDIEFMNNSWWPELKKMFVEIPDAAAVSPMSPLETGWGYGLGSNPNFVCPDWGVVYNEKFIAPKKPDGTAFGYKEEFTEEDYKWLNQYKKGHIEGMAMWLPVFRRDRLEEIGLFDERFYPGGAEDYDWNARCYSKGYRAISTCNSWVWHHWTSSRNYPGIMDSIDETRRFGDVNSLWEVDETAPRNPIYHTPPRRRISEEVVSVDY